jgi:hypothetical protein
MTISSPEKQQSGVKPHHYGAVLAVGAIGGIIAYILFHFVIGMIFRVAEIVVIVGLIFMIGWLVFRHATKD